MLAGYSWSPLPAHFSGDCTRQICCIAPGTPVSHEGLACTACPGGAPSLLISTTDSSCAWRREAGRTPLCATARKRECSSGRRGGGGERKDSSGGEWKKSGSSQSSRSGGSCSAALLPLFRRTLLSFSGLLPRPCGRRLPSRPDSR